MRGAAAWAFCPSKGCGWQADDEHTVSGGKCPNGCGRLHLLDFSSEDLAYWKPWIDHNHIRVAWLAEWNRDGVIKPKPMAKTLPDKPPGAL